ncbi:MAG: cytochrome c3 family protein [Coriobacteriia bacterium]
MRKRLTASALIVLAVVAVLFAAFGLAGCGKPASGASSGEESATASPKTAYVVTAPVAAAATTTSVTMNKHADRGVSCKQCHDSDAPTSAPESNKACVGCHSIDSLIQATASYEDLANKSQNPHDSHLKGASCLTCHKNHADSVLYCDTCHKPAYGWNVP